MQIVGRPDFTNCLSNGIDILGFNLQLSYKYTLTMFSSLTLAYFGVTSAGAQILANEINGETPLESPFVDPDIIYLEADELINDEAGRTLTALGEVEGRYQSRSLRADEVKYFLDEGRVIASGSVVLVNSDGSTQFADQIELSNELETGTATNFTIRQPGGGVTGASHVKSRKDEGIDLYNAYYTACEVCAEKKTPTWQIKARQVSQNKDKKAVLYKDVVFELFGVPVLYSPYFAHPDPEAERANGWLTPFGGYSGSKGIFIETPYYFKLGDYSELTATPHLYSKVNPLLELEYRRRFYSGDLNIEGSFTYANVFDTNGESFSNSDIFLINSEHAPLGKRLRSHFFADGEFDLSRKFALGFTAQAASDDLYLKRYGLGEPSRSGLYSSGSQRLTSQAYGVYQDDTARYSVASFGFQSLRTNIRAVEDSVNTFRIGREDDSGLPIIAPKIEFSKYFNDPVFKGRFELLGDYTRLSRQIGNDYQRATIGGRWSKTHILPGGIEAKPFGEIRYDMIGITPYDNTDELDLPKSTTNRMLGQTGIDFRMPFIKSTDRLDIIVEPRILLTQNFGNGERPFFEADSNNNGIADIDLLQDSIDVDLDHNLIWSPNKSTGYDLWQKGFRADVGGSVKTLWGENQLGLFVGQSYARNVEDVFELASGLKTDKSDLVGELEFKLGSEFLFDARVRYDEDDSAFRRLDTGLRYNIKPLKLSGRYYQIDQARSTDSDLGPSEEISGKAELQITKHWAVSYGATRDLDRDITRKQSFGLAYDDECTKILLSYNKSFVADDISRDADSITLRISLSTLGGFGYRENNNPNTY